MKTSRLDPCLRLCFCLGLGLGMTATGCGISVQRRLDSVRSTIRQARDNGAYRCAPRELALAESHAEFTRTELQYGNYVRAKQELGVASSNADQALALSPKDKCAPSVTVVEPLRRKLRIVTLDVDHDGIEDNVDKCPDDPEDKDGFEDQDGCPDPDNDQDGILDRQDKCPNAAEDKDGFEDQDGCPDPDNDRDGIADGDDKCPDEAGPMENQGCPDRDRDGDTVVDRLDRCPDAPGPAENQGCPQYKLINVTKEKIELKEKIHFQTAKAVIQRDSFGLLNEIADVLKKRPEIQVRIEGHTDSRAKRKYNLRLSQARATAVKRYLVGRGIDAKRMEAVGYGPDRPIGDNRSAIGRENNRRVEFVITQQ
ncbi:MAG TPA: OmpA family protein [Polyangia bacterium]|nr:OmpA family protein [Polyangia bacterium]